MIGSTGSFSTKGNGVLRADFAVVSGGGFEEFVAAIGGEGAHAFSAGLHG
jgi:hypothetical protein